MTKALTLGLVVLALVGCASAATGPPPDLSGTWNGTCSDCPVKTFRLVLAQSGDALTGTLQASGRTGLGEAEMPLQNGKLVGRTVTFDTVGRDGVPLVVQLRVSSDGRTMDGQGRHRAGFGMSFTRATP